MLHPELISLDNLVFRTYMGWTAVLVLKIFAAGLYTGLMRFITAVSRIYMNLHNIYKNLQSMYVLYINDCG